MDASSKLTASTTDGGPAFPSVARDGNWQPRCDGMSLRDYFAAHVAGMLMMKELDRLTDEGHMKEAARISYLMADALLQAK